ncbi:hypothetical protein [Clostridium hydrogeniformans]|uniref:hypothetical protein n=1 Tax=Clostridium hydrogeniformans TaxID=349933 RepID=UPI0004815E85|nr:hypothetical protein [Clostridium hydrogeniformans]
MEYIKRKVAMVKDKYKNQLKFNGGIIIGFTVMRVLAFICQLYLYGIYIFIILGGVVPFANKFGEFIYIVYLLIPMTNIMILKKCLSIRIKSSSEKFGDLVYCKFEKELMMSNPIIYISSKWLIKIMLILGFSFGVITHKLNILYPII